ncbi:hypothetical protein NL676_022551 [Syzygium grande]|nr:hypothetical protein NL676_022551 [Syzygium grande]
MNSEGGLTALLSRQLRSEICCERDRRGEAQREAAREAGVTASAHDRVDEEGESRGRRPSSRVTAESIAMDSWLIVTDSMWSSSFSHTHFHPKPVANKAHIQHLLRRQSPTAAEIPGESPNLLQHHYRPTCLRSGRCALSSCRLNLCLARRHTAATCASIRGHPLCHDEGSRPPTPWATSPRPPFGHGDPLIEVATAALTSDLGRPWRRNLESWSQMPPRHRYGDKELRSEGSSEVVVQLGDLGGDR